MRTTKVDIMLLSRFDLLVVVVVNMHGYSEVISANENTENMIQNEINYSETLR